MTRTGQTAAYNLYHASFPSAYKSDSPSNNTVYCEYYRVPGDQSRPVVIVLDIMDGSMSVPRIMANSFATAGMDACIMIMPYYGPRRADGEREQPIKKDIDFMIISFRQAVMDVRRTARWLGALDWVNPDKIGICGTSMGGFITALSASVDGRFPRAAVLLAGGDLATVFTTQSKEVSQIHQEITTRNIQPEELKKLLESIEPLSFADRLHNTKLLMINGSTDKIVPADCAQKLASAAHTEIKWFPTGHYGMVDYIFPAVQLTVQHFSTEQW